MSSGRCAPRSTCCRTRPRGSSTPAPWPRSARRCARPRRAQLTGAAALTAAQLRVGRLAASGLGNREIAETLFLTEKTVEGHLSAAYRKLGIASRTELAAALDR